VGKVDEGSEWKTTAGIEAEEEGIAVNRKRCIKFCGEGEAGQKSGAQEKGKLFKYCSLSVKSYGFSTFSLPFWRSSPSQKLRKTRRGTQAWRAAEGAGNYDNFARVSRVSVNF
jgi:hypothetical protein